MFFTAALLSIKPLSDDDTRFRHGFGAEASLLLAQSALAVTHDTTSLCWIVISHIHADIYVSIYLYIYLIPIFHNWYIPVPVC